MTTTLVIISKQQLEDLDTSSMSVDSSHYQRGDLVEHELQEQPQQHRRVANVNHNSIRHENLSQPWEVMPSRIPCQNPFNIVFVTFDSHNANDVKPMAMSDLGESLVSTIILRVFELTWNGPKMLLGDDNMENPISAGVTLIKNTNGVPRIDPILPIF